MSRPAERRGPRPRSDAGFTLVEVVVVLGILGVLIATVLPGMVAGIRAGDLARTNTQARGLAQAELERMRNLPFHLAFDAGEFIDVLDHYFPDREKPEGSVSCGSAERWTVPEENWSGYVEPGDTRCGWEPTTGAFYRQVRPAAAGAANPDTTDFVIVTDTRFLTDATPASVVPPPADYSHAVTGRDAPPASQLGVTVTVFPRNGSTRAPVTSATQIGRQSISPPRAGSTVSVTTLEVGTTTVDGLPLSLSAGVLDLATSLTGSSEARGVLSATLTGLGTGQQAAGADLSLVAPPDSTAPATSKAPAALDASGCALACWGTTLQSGGSVRASDALPGVGAPTSALTTSVSDHANSGIAVAQGQGAAYRPGLALTAPLVRMDPGSGVRTGVASSCATAETGSMVRVTAGGWLRTTSPTDPTPTLVEACGTGRAAPVAVLPTSFAPQGVLRVRLDRAWARCVVSGGAHSASATYDYSVRVERWSPSGYVDLVVLTPGATDPLAATPPAAYDLGGGRTLADYVASWSSVRATDVVQRQDTGAARVDVPGILRLTTQPLRDLPSAVPTTAEPSPTATPTADPTADPTATPTADPSASTGPTASPPPSPTPTASPDPLSSLSLTLGSLSCSAQDAR